MKLSTWEQGWYGSNLGSFLAAALTCPLDLPLGHVSLLLRREVGG